MELEPSKSVLQDFNNMYTKYLINKTLLDFCKQTLFCHNKNLDDDCTSLAKNIIEELAIKEYVLLKKDSKDEANNINFLGLSNDEVQDLSKQNATALANHMNQLMKTTYKNHLNKLNTICHDELEKPAQETNLEIQRMNLYEQIYNNNVKLLEKKIQRMELIKQFFYLKNKLVQYDSTHAVDLLEQSYMIEDSKIKLLKNAVELAIFKSPEAVQAASLVLQDIESEIQTINNKIEKLQASSSD